MVVTGSLQDLVNRARPDGSVKSFTVITTEANHAMAELHHRMPVILAPDDLEAWLDPETAPEPSRRFCGPVQMDGSKLTR